MLTLHSIAAQLRAKAEAKPIEHPEAPHFVYDERDHWDGVDSMADWSVQHLEDVK